MNSILSPNEIKKLLPLTPEIAEKIEEKRSIAKEILLGNDSRFVIVVGPCSIHHIGSALKYAEMLKNLSLKVQDRCFIIMRVYIEKPRTTIGWKGFVNDPDIDNSCDLQKGLIQSRAFFLELAKRDIPIAVEFLDPLIANYISDLVTWGFIGARTSSSQIHRQLASSLPFPVGFKNTVHGCYDTAINGMITARTPHSFLSLNHHDRITKVQSKGNLFSHLVLRGSETSENYDESTIIDALGKLEEKGLSKKILIDCAHGNCQKDFTKQQTVFFSIIEQIKEQKYPLLGVMLESFLKAGRYPFNYEDPNFVEDISITDPCIDWETTEKLILWAHSQLKPGLCEKL